ncbi:MAG: ATP-binding cassette domain-containing protein [Bacteroidota bacterium]
MIEIRCTKQLMTASGLEVLRLDVALPIGKCIGVFGQSGIGKTTLLRLLAGLEKPDSGWIRFKDQVWSDENHFLPPQERQVGLAAQEASLFPHLSVRQNMAFGMPKDLQPEMLSELLAIMGLEQLADQNPRRLSGGQQQRVSLARALLAQPQLLLLDEPFTGLDQAIKGQILNYVQTYRQKHHLSTIIVSHSIPDLYKLCDLVISMENHEARVVDTPERLFGGTNLTGSIRQHAEVLKMEPSGVVIILTVAIGQQIAKMVAHPEDLMGIQVGDLVLLETKSFSPILRKNQKS